MYHPHRLSRSEYLSIRRLRYHIRHWGPENAPKIVMLHGWMDVSASFQFTVDALQREWHVLAPDWRGYGLTQWPDTDCYWFADYLADLDAILTEISPKAPVALVGHSMGGNIAMLYAGARPERVGKLVNLEGFGLPGQAASEAPVRYERWLNALREPPVLRPYADEEAVAARLRKNNPRLSLDRARFLAAHWARATGRGWEVQADPAHKMLGPMLYRVEEVMACWRRIAAPVLWVEGAASDVIRQLGGIPDLAWRIGHVPALTRVELEEAGHMVHHDQPEKVAALIENFLAS